MVASTRRFGSRGQGGNAGHVANVVPVLQLGNHGSTMGSHVAPERFRIGSSLLYLDILFAVAFQPTLDDGRDQSRLEVDNSFARGCQALKNEIRSFKDSFRYEKCKSIPG